MMWEMVLNRSEKITTPHDIKEICSTVTDGTTPNIVNEKCGYCTCPSINVQGIYPYREGFS